MRSYLAICAVATVLLLNALVADMRAATGSQTSTAPASVFEVASIKRNDSGNPGMSNSSRPDRYILTNAPIRSMIAFAYPISSGEIVSGPDWMTSERYDVNASAGRDVTRDELVAMVRSLLAERFRFRAHVGSRVRPTYALTIASAGFYRGSVT